MPIGKPHIGPPSFLSNHIAPRPLKKVNIIGKGEVLVPMPVSSLEAIVLDIISEKGGQASTSEVLKGLRERGMIADNGSNRSDSGQTIKRLKEAGVDIESGKAGEGYRLPG